MAENRIISRQNQQVKDAVQLRQRKWRVRRGLFLIDGVREIERAVASGVPLRTVFFCAELCESGQTQEVLRQISTSTRDIHSVVPAVFAKLAFGEGHAAPVPKL